MTGKEALTNITNVVFDDSYYERILQEDVEQIKRDLDLLDLYKKFFKYYLTEIQGIKYLALSNSGDIRRPDSLLKITDDEYEILKEGLEK